MSDPQPIRGGGGGMVAWVRVRLVSLCLVVVVVGLYVAGLAVTEEVRDGRFLRWGLSWRGVVASGHWEQVVTYGFFHGTVLHVVLNGLGLWVLGVKVERIAGVKVALGVLMSGVVLGGLLEVGLMGFKGSERVLIGISGGLAAWFGWLVRVDPEARLKGLGLRLRNVFVGWLLFEAGSLVLTWGVGEEVSWIAANACHLLAGLVGWLMGRMALGRLLTLEDLQKERARREAATGS